MSNNINKSTTSIKKSLIACAVISTLTISTLTVTPVMAAEVNTEQKTLKQAQKENENIGFGTGMVLGAIVGGPIGAVVSSFIGVFAAKHMNVSNERDLLTNQLNEEKNHYQLALEEYQDKIHQAEQAYQAQLLSFQQEQHITSQLQAENLLMSLQFSTGSSEIKSHYHEQISSLAKILKQSPNLNVDLSGYTDLQGDDQLNHALSIARVNSVKHALINQGVAPDRINLFAFGEQAPVVASNDQQASFYDRRVVIKLQADNQTSTNQQTVSNF